MEEKKTNTKTLADHLALTARHERQAAERWLDQVRQENDYYREKAVAKLTEFLRREEAALQILLEIRRDFPELADTVLERKPYWRTKLEQAESEWRNHQPDSDA